MLRQLRVIIVVNAVLALLFVYYNYYIWHIANNTIGLSFAYVDWSALVVNVNTGIPNTDAYINFPFILFWILMITNLILIIRLQRSKETKQNPS